LNRKIKKVLLFIPPAFSFKQRVDVNPLPPLGLAYLGAVLERNDIEVKVFDCLAEHWHDRVQTGDNTIRIGTPFDQIEEIIRDYGPDIIGVNNLFTKQRKNAHEIYRLAKKIDSNIITIAGGAHPTVLPELVLSDENVDFAVLGEGEQTIIDLIDAIEGKRSLTSLDGVGYKENGQIRIIAKTKFIEDLDKLPYPARHLLNMEKYFGLKASHGSRKKRRFSPIVTSRGCPARCTFCSAHKVWGRKFRYRSPENVIREMKHIKKEYGIEEIMFEDDNATLDARRAEKIFDLMIEEKLDFIWDTPNGVSAWTLTEGLINKMKESGCYTLNFAVETGNQYVMDNIIRKPLRVEKVKQLVDYAHKINLNVGIFLVMGMPGETEEQMWDSFRLSKELGVYFPHISIATPYPGSKLYDICVENKYFSDGFSLDDLFTRSFCISTKDWNGEKLRRIYAKGQIFLFMSYFKRHPIKFINRIIRKFFTNPGRLFRYIYIIVTNKKDLSNLR